MNQWHRHMILKIQTSNRYAFGCIQNNIFKTSLEKNAKRLILVKRSYGYTPRSIWLRCSEPCANFNRSINALVSFTAIRGQKTNPVQRKSDKKTESKEHQSIDPDVTLYNRPTNHVVNLDLRPGAGQSSIYRPYKSELIDIGLNVRIKEAIRHIQQQEIQNLNKSDDDSARVHSIDELMWREIKPRVEVSQLPGLYARLAKIRLSGLVVVTTMSGYMMAPGAFDLLTFIFCCSGTALTSASANAVNQYLEVPFDAQMNRTKTRPLVRGQVSALHTICFAAVSGVTGAAMLALGVNALTAGLGVFNLALYTLVYTPMKRLSIANTWVGSIVGAIPPMMGWAASAGTLHTGAFMLAAIMFAWQFPHFCALSWNLRPDYSRAGYRMMSVVNPGLCQRTALRYSVALTGVCLAMPYFDVTTWTFAADSLPLNLYLVYLAARFYRYGDSSSSRKLFRFSLIHLPALLILMLISKKQFGRKVSSSTAVAEAESSVSSKQSTA